MSENEGQKQLVEEPLNLKSKVEDQVSQMSFLRRSLLFAELAMLTYNDELEATEAAAEMGFPITRFFDRDGAQAFMFANDIDAVIACRGTEPNEWNDIKADANATTALAETVGRVHSGFKQEVDDLWPMLEEALVNNEKTLYFTGHSLGGAMATICAGRCLLSHIKTNPEELYTYGSPRVGNKRYVNHCQLNYYRWVNNNDIVTRVPPAWLGFRHTGEEIYLDRNGRIKKLTGFLRFRDRVKGLLRGLLRLEIDYLADHSMRDYVKHIYTAIQEEESK